jgi:hypothetical protein
MDLLDNGGREVGQWPPLPIEHFLQQEKLTANESGDGGVVFRQKMAPSQWRIFSA